MAKTKLERSNAAHERAIKALNAKVGYHESIIQSQNSRQSVMSKEERNHTYDAHMGFAGVPGRKKKNKK